MEPAKPSIAQPPPKPHSSNEDTQPDNTVPNMSQLPFNNDNWPQIAMAMRLTGMANQLLQHMVFVAKEDKEVIFNIAPDKASLRNDKAIKTMEKRLLDMGYTVKLTIEVGENTTNKNVDQIQTEARQNAFDSKKKQLESNDDFNRIRSILDAEIIS